MSHNACLSCFIVRKQVFNRFNAENARSYAAADTGRLESNSASISVSLNLNLICGCCSLIYAASHKQR